MLAGCASVSPPDGGDRDKTPPRLISSIPTEKAVLVTGKKVVLVFDEPVTTNPLANTLTISPDTDLGIPTIREKGEELEIEFKNALAPNTTYFLDLGADAITDITEKNKAPRVRLSFSTGATIDSGSVSGLIVNSWTNQPESGAIVGLYPASDTVNPAKQRPLYRTVTTEKGEYMLPNIRPGRYQLFGFNDANKSRLYEEPERIAYAGQNLLIAADDTVVQLVSGRLDTRRPFILSQKQAAGQAALTFSEGVQTVKIIGGESASIKQLRTSADPKTVKLFAKPLTEPVKLTILSTDSAGNVGRDTVMMKFAAETGLPAVVRTARIGGEVKLVNDQRIAEFVLPVAVEVRAGIIGQLAPVITVVPEPKASPTQAAGKPASPAPKPVPTPKPALPSINITYPEMAALDSSQSVLRVEVPKTTEANAYRLLLDSTALQLVSQQPLSFRPTTIPIRDREATETTGTIVAQIKTKQPSYQIDLLTEKGQVVASVSRLQKGTTIIGAVAPVRWPQLAAGKYRVRVLIDADGNGRWDGADARFIRQPEPVWFYPEPLEVRANWENEAILTF